MALHVRPSRCITVEDKVASFDDRVAGKAAVMHRLAGGFAVVKLRSDRPLSATATMVHEVLLELGRNKNILTLVDDFVDSSELEVQLRDDTASALRARGVDLPQGVTLHVVNGYGAEPKPILMFKVTVRHLSVLVDAILSWGF